MHVRPQFASLLLFAVITAASGPADAQVSPIIYLNRCVGGCVITSGASNAQANTSPVPTGGTGVYTLSAFGHGDDVWNDVVECMRETYAPYGAVITDVEPPPGTQYHEAMVAGDPEEIGREPNVLGTAAGGGGPTCEAVNNAISFTFANAHPPDAEYICVTIAQESGHTWGLDHEFECASPMTYLPACGRQFFRNRALPCGEYEARSCGCFGAAQNSHNRLLQIFGPGEPIPAPQVTLANPPAGTVGQEFTISGDATAYRGLGRAVLLFNGYEWDSRPGNFRTMNQGFLFTASPDLPDGVIDIEVRVYDDLEQGYGSVTRTVTKGAPCTSADTCAAGQSCEAGKCFWAPASGEYGAECTYPQFCLSGTCAPQGVCSQACQTGVSGDCPNGSECVADQGQAGFCIEGGGEGGGGGGCSTGGDTSPVWMLVLFGLIGFTTLSRSYRRQGR